MQDDASVRRMGEGGRWLIFGHAMEREEQEAATAMLEPKTLEQRGGAPLAPHWSTSIAVGSYWFGDGRQGVIPQASPFGPLVDTTGDHAQSQVLG